MGAIVGGFALGVLVTLVAVEVGFRMIGGVWLTVRRRRF